MSVEDVDVIVADVGYKAPDSRGVESPCAMKAYSLHVWEKPFDHRSVSARGTDMAAEAVRWKAICQVDRHTLHSTGGQRIGDLKNANLVYRLQRLSSTGEIFGLGRETPHHWFKSLRKASCSPSREC